MVIYYQGKVLNCVDWGETLENRESEELGNPSTPQLFYSTSLP